MEDKMQQKLLTEFAVPSYDQWLQLVEEQLKGVPFEQKLVTQTVEGISIQPVYRREDKKPTAGSLPGCFPFRRNAQLTGNVSQGWQVSQQFRYAEPVTFNEAVVWDAKRGLTAAAFALDEVAGRGQDPDQDTEGLLGRSGLSLFSRDDVLRSLQSIDLSALSLRIRPRLAFLPFYSLLINALDFQKVSRQTLRGGMVSDPLAELARSGKLNLSLAQAYGEMAICAKWSATHTPNFKTLGIDLCPYSDAGASATQELAVALATGVEYLRELQNRGVSIDTVAGNIEFYLAIGSDFFINLAKIRAARMLWAQVVSTCGGSETVQKASIHASTARYNKTMFDPHVNLLRATTEAYSAILAGCDSVSVAPFDEVFSLPDELSRRISRNIQIVLKEECLGHKIIDPGGGSWYLESLTDQLAERAWGEFQAIEKQGGMAQTLLSGSIQRQIAELSAKRKDEVAQRKQVVVGTNLYSNQEETEIRTFYPDFATISKNRKAEAEAHKKSRLITIDHTALAAQMEKTMEEGIDSLLDLVTRGATLGQLSQALGHHNNDVVTAEKLDLGRLAGEYETLRQKAIDYKLKNGTLPQVFLVNMGPPKQHKARADFSTGFLQPGGFAVVSSAGFDTVENAVAATVASKARIAVICSTDDTYPELVPAFAAQVKKANPGIVLVLAGYPKEHIESFKAAGIDEFIHLKANNLKLLKLFQEKAGV